MKQFSWLIALALLFACKKENDTDETPTPGPADSVRILQSIDIEGPPDDLIFSYDNNRLIKLHRPYVWAINSPAHIYYRPDGQVSHIIAQDVSVNQQEKRASMIPVYNASNKCVKIFYKKSSTEPLTAAYYTNLNDGKQDQRYDSLVWAANGRIESSHWMDQANGIITRYKVVRFSYLSATDTIPNELRWYDVNNNVESLNDRLVIETDAYDSYHKDWWFMPYLEWTAYIADYSGAAMNYYHLFDDPSTKLETWLSFVKKRLTKYSVYNSWGVYNYTGVAYTYQWNADSTVQRVSRNGGDFMNYKFKKVPK